MKKILSVLVLIMFTMMLVGCSSEAEKKSKKDQEYIGEKWKKARSTRAPKA